MCSLLGVVYLLACPSLKWHLTKKEQKTPHEISTTHKIMNYPDWPSQLVIWQRVIQNEIILDQVKVLLSWIFLLNFHMSVLLELGLSLAQLLLPTYFKSILDLGIKLPGFFFPGIKLPGFFFPVILGIKLPGLFFPRSNLGLVQVSAFKFTCILN